RRVHETSRWCTLVQGAPSGSRETPKSEHGGIDASLDDHTALIIARTPPSSYRGRAATKQNLRAARKFWTLVIRFTLPYPHPFATALDRIARVDAARVAAVLAVLLVDVVDHGPQGLHPGEDTLAAGELQGGGGRGRIWTWSWQGDEVAGA